MTSVIVMMIWQLMVIMTNDESSINSDMIVMIVIMKISSGINISSNDGNDNVMY